MSNPSKRKGTLYESAVRQYLRKQLPWLDIDRRILHGNKDTGDINGLFLDVPHDKPVRMVVECKNTPSAPNLSKYLKQTAVEAQNDGATSIGILLEKLPGISTTLNMMSLQPVVMFWDDRWIFDDSGIGFTDSHAGFTSPTFIELKRFANRSASSNVATVWYRNGNFKLPIIVLSLGLLCKVICDRHEKATSHALA